MLDSLKQNHTDDAAASLSPPQNTGHAPLVEPSDTDINRELEESLELQPRSGDEFGKVTFSNMNNNNNSPLHFTVVQPLNPQNEITRSMIAKPTVMNNLLAGKRTLWSQNPSRRYSQELLALNQVMADSVFDEQENPTRQETKTLPPLKRPVNVLEPQPKKDNDWTPSALSPQTKRSMQNDVADSMLLVTQVNDLAIIEQDELIYHNDTLNSHRLIDNPSMMVTSLDKQRMSQRLIDESPVKHPPGAEQIEN